MFRRGDRQPSGYTWRQQTLTALMKARTYVRMSCRDCGHTVTHSPAWLAMMCDVPYEATLYELAQRLVCRKCGSHRVGAEVAPEA